MNGTVQTRSLPRQRRFARRIASHSKSIETSVQCHRLALQMMARHPAHPHPVCYAVWYEYAAGINPALNCVIDAITARDETLDDMTIHALYREHVAGRDELQDCVDENRREIEKLRGEISRAREDALTDEMTGLLNRRGFDLAFQRSLGDTATIPSLLIADIDRFKTINDGCGHAFGDRVIRAVADILRGNIKRKDVAARYGGDEFIVLLPDTPLYGARSLAEKIRSMVAESHFRRATDKDADVGVTISIGVARHLCGETLADFVERADTALYASKTNGRNRVTAAEQ